MDTASLKKPNRLIDEKSPYLLQHAFNPVDWYPWGDEAFSIADREDKPVFLSIGYSTCHWCHVMERESFEDDEVARVLNSSFVSVKVDREERPDVDHVYMTVCQAMTGRGGWPLTILITPDKKPFFAGTYFPREPRPGMPGLIDILGHVARLWRTNREELLADTGKILSVLSRLGPGRNPGDIPGPGILDAAFESLSRKFDPVHGGFGDRPKFPIPQNFFFLLRYAYRTGNRKATDMTEKTLTAMRAGGIFDQVGFGFHRYSTDESFLLPHFEKMLSDQALLCLAYIEAFQTTGNEALGKTAEEILEYVLRDMRLPGGGFATAEDADSEGVEGKFYVWSRREIIEILGPEDGERFCRLFGVREEGNFREEATGELTGSNILHLGREKPAERAFITDSRKRLLLSRSSRVRPLRDDKILTGLNGLMIAALARAGRVLGQDRYIDAAREAAGFILEKLSTGEGRLLRRHREGESAIPGYLDDHACLLWGLLELYDAGFDPEHLAGAVRLAHRMIDLFGDPEKGGFFLTGRDDETVLLPMKEVQDGAIPSGNSVAMTSLLRLFYLTGENRFLEAAEKTARAFAADVSESPDYFTYFLIGIDLLLGPVAKIVIVGEPTAPDTQALIGVLGSGFFPQTVTILRPPSGGAAEKIDTLSAPVRGKAMVGEKATAWLCGSRGCMPPVTDAPELSRLLGLLEKEESG